MIRHGPGKAVRVRRDSARHTADEQYIQAQTTLATAQPALPSTTTSTVRSSATPPSAHNDVVIVPTEDQPVSLTSSTAITNSNTVATRSPRPSPLFASLKLPCEVVCRTSVASVGTTTTAVKMWQEQLELYPMLRLVPLQFVLEQRYSQWREGQASPTLPVATNSTIESNSQPVPNLVPRDSSYPYALAASCPQLDLSASYEVPRSLRAVLWGGCKPDFLRATLWRVLCDYAPTTLTRQRDELQRKRALYRSYTTYYYNNNNNSGNSNGQNEEGYMNSAAESKYAQRQVDESASHTPPSLRPVSATRADSTSHTAASQTNMSSAPKDNAANTVRVANMSSVPLSGASPMKPGSPLRWGLATSLTRSERAMQSQIALDLPRHEATLFKCGLCVNALARCLFLWAQRHPAVGYVQGMDDIVCVFYELFLSEALVQVAMERQTSSEEHKGTTTALQIDPTSAHVRQGGDEGALDTRIEQQQHQQSSAEWEQCTASLSLQLLRRRLTLQLSMNPTLLTRLPHTELEAAVATLPESYLLQVEADTYSCADRLLGQLQDNFTPGLPGMTRNAAQLERLLRSANAGALLDRLASQGVTLMNGCFQWLHCLLARELPLHLLLSLWDTYFAMGSDDWPRFHLYVCAALLLSLRQVLSRVATEQILQLLRSPFAASLAQLTPASRPVVHRASDATSATPSQWQARRAEAKREAQWLELLIADAYRLWRLYPHAVQG